MRALLRAAGMAAIAGGSLRIADSFLKAPPDRLGLLYFFTDVLLLGGIAGLWSKRRTTLGIAGTPGIAVFAAGILMVRASALGVGTYTLGATISLLGLALYSIDALFKGSRVAPIAWLAALTAGVLGSVVAAGVLFGLGFVAAGLDILYGAPQSAQTATSTVT